MAVIFNQTGMTTEESDPLLTNSRRNPFDRYDRTRRVSELFDSTSHNSDYSHSSHGTTTTRSRAGSGFSNDLLENAGDNPQDWQLQELEAGTVKSNITEVIFSTVQYVYSVY